ncbi:hypothetical protein LCGC14_2793840, partial [marine sediment metagenome]
FYTASPYLAVLRRRYQGDSKTILIDPDEIVEGNYGRQWPGFMGGTLKVSCAARSLSLDRLQAMRLANTFDSTDNILAVETDGWPVLAIVNVDNDHARIAVADWLASRMSMGIMVVSGCERLFGQCYSGVWMDGQAVHDWRDHHKEVGQEGTSTLRCNIQDVRANALTGVLVGMCVEDMSTRLVANEWDEVHEFYWEMDSRQAVRMWTSGAVCGKGE